MADSIISLVRVWKNSGVSEGLSGGFWFYNWFSLVSMEFGGSNWDGFE